MVGVRRDLLRHHSKPEDVAAYVKAASDSAHSALDDLVESFGDRLGSARVELKKGNPEDVIPRFVLTSNERPRVRC